jgi:outer membrane lipoprotein SlyB
MSKSLLSLLSSGAATLFALVAMGCAAPATTYEPPEIRQGVIEQITPVNLTSNHNQGLGAVLGGAAGLGLGSLIGAGTGRDVAMVAGAIGGAIVGNEVQRNNAQPIPGQQIIVRTQNGVLVAVTQPLGPYLEVGQRVYLQGGGENTRVIPR